MSESHLIAHHQFSSHFTKTSRHTWAHSTTQQLWTSAAEDNRELHNYSRSRSFSYHRLITGQCLTKTPRGSSIAGCKIACPISVLTFSSGGKKFKAEKTGMMLREAVSCICVPQDKNTRNIKTRDYAELRCMSTKQTKDNTMTNGVYVKWNKAHWSENGIPSGKMSKTKDIEIQYAFSQTIAKQTATSD